MADESYLTDIDESRQSSDTSHYGRIFKNPFAPENFSWWGEAECVGINPAVFHPESGDRATSAKAKNICRSCSVSQQCLDQAVSDRTLLGIRGGTSDRERRRIRRQRKLDDQIAQQYCDMDMKKIS